MDLPLISDVHSGQPDRTDLFEIGEPSRGGDDLDSSQNTRVEAVAPILASDAASNINGVILPTDSGWSAV
jgi:hypothetical protein